MEVVEGYEVAAASDVARLEGYVLLSVGMYEQTKYLRAKSRALIRSNM